MMRLESKETFHRKNTKILYYFCFSFSLTLVDSLDTLAVFKYHLPNFSLFIHLFVGSRNV
jgi:hypothetical protein